METTPGNLLWLHPLTVMCGVFLLVVAMAAIRRAWDHRRDARVTRFWTAYQKLQADTADMARDCGHCGHVLWLHEQDGRGRCHTGLGLEGFTEAELCQCRYATPDPELARHGLALVAEARALGIDIRTPNPAPAPAPTYRRLS